MNPLIQSAEIIDTRNRYFGRSRKTSQSDFDPELVQQQRDEANRVLASVRDGFWGMKLSELNRRLDSPILATLPDMAVAAERLQRLATLRPQFPLLAQEKRCNNGLFRAFKEIVTLPPQEAGPTKERMLQQIAFSRNLKECKTSVQCIRAQFPELYSLESDWFVMVENVTRATATREGHASYSSDSGGIPGWVVWLGIFMLVRLLRFFVAHGFSQ